MDLMFLLKAMIEQNSSDLHLRVGCQPAFRVNGTLYRANTETITPADMEEWLKLIMNDKHREAFSHESDVDIGLGFQGIGRFRVNVYKQRGTAALAIRSIKTNIPVFTELGLPEVILDIATKNRGLVLATGTTGSGKSTLLASMLDHINENKAVNIITIEDPIEFLFKNKKSSFVQRQIGTDAETFASALRASFRQDPDVIMIGEVRDSVTMETALSASDTGHLVLSTLHTMNAIETINRIVSFFPPHQHDQVRLVLSSVLVAVISLRLIPRKDGKGRVPAAEVMINNASVSEYILDPQKLKLIPDMIAEGYTQYGSQTFDQSLYQLYKNDIISFQVAMQYASNPDDFELKIAGGVSGTSDRRWLES
ncbi:MAG: PilT/PilU family type 4a pilus ATPase [Chitinivibrionales bacterium]|nr:PilT/PilU family type 4a pilus ATPase [Chitinivibrionales bacterium]